MELRILGCHGGETPKHRTSSFLVDGRLAIDAGALTSTLTLPDQDALRTILVSHSHMDHIRDLGSIVDNRFQRETGTLEIVGVQATIDALRSHFFNGVVWPDFTKIESSGQPAVRFTVVKPDAEVEVDGYKIRPIMVNHTVDTSAFVVSRGGKNLVYGGDTGPTDDLWAQLNAMDHIDAVMMECSLPDEQSTLARHSLHHTPATLLSDLRKLEKPEETPVLIYHVKPVFEREVHRQLAQQTTKNLEVLELDEELIF